MITEALQHCPGIGPARLEQLHGIGVHTWTDVLESAHRLPQQHGRTLTDECRRCLAALDRGDIQYFLDRFVPQDRWRILAHFFEDISYFDIETAGLQADAPITVIVCWHRRKLHTYVENENLDDFLELLDDVTLLASFNGSSFDVPRVLNTFHVPELPCPHLDLRWACYHRGWRGSLKRIASRVGIARPEDLQDMDGAAAVELWYAWRSRGDRGALDKLVRYCSADVLLLVMVAHRLAGRSGYSDLAYWSRLRENDRQCVA